MEGTVVVFASTSQATIFLARVSAELLEIFGALLGIAQIEGGGTRRRFARLNLKDLPLEIVDTYANAYGPAGTNYLSFNLEQQAQIVSDWFARHHTVANPADNIGLSSQAAINDPYFRYIADNVRVGRL